MSISNAVNLASFASGDTLSVDSVNDRVGIASTVPTTTLDVDGNITSSGIRIGTGGTVGPVGSGIVTYFGDGSQLSGISADATSLKDSGGDIKVQANTFGAVVTGVLTSSSFVGDITGDVTGNADTSTTLATARNIAGVSFNGSADISLNNNAITNGAGYITTSFVNTNQLVNGAGFLTSSGTIALSQGLTGSPNIDVGTLTADNASFSGSISVGGTLTYEDVSNVDSVGLITARSGVIASGIGISVPQGGVTVTGVVTATSFNGSGANLTNLNIPIPVGFTELDAMLFS